MIRGINSYSSAIMVTNGTPYVPYISPGAVGAGMLRYNSNTQNIEISDGVSWQSMSSTTAGISLTPEVEDLLVWLRQHKKEVEEEKRLRESNQAVKNAWEQYQVIKTLSTQTESV